MSVLQNKPKSEGSDAAAAAKKKKDLLTKALAKSQHLKKNQQNLNVKSSVTSIPTSSISTSSNSGPQKLSARAANNRDKTSNSASNLSSLQKGMARKLQGAEFRWLNEKLYTTRSHEALNLFQARPEMFDAYHIGFRSQVQAWPSNPVDGYITLLQSTCKSDTVVADMGCGDGALGLALGGQMKVYSFDLVARHPHITACDIAHVPLPPASVDIVLFSLSLMGTNFMDFLHEAYRILRVGGVCHIAEVISRFTDMEAFCEALAKIGFKRRHMDTTNKMFVLFMFEKRAVSSASKKRKTAPSLESITENTESLLQPCVYKKR